MSKLLDSFSLAWKGRDRHRRFVGLGGRLRHRLGRSRRRYLDLCAPRREARRDPGDNIGSVLGSTSAFLPQAAYASSKAAIVGLTRDLAQQWTGRKGIRVNALAPGFFASEMTDRYPDGYLEQMMLRVPAGRKGDASVLVAAAVFLAGDASSPITGALSPSMAGC